MKQSANKPLSREDLQFVTSVSEAILEQTPRGARILLWSLLAFVVLAIAWAAWAQLDEITRGEGEIIPSSQLQVVQNLEGGIVSEILVNEGDLVEKGQVLLKIDDTRFASTFKENAVRQLELKAKAARLQAEANNRDFVPPEGFESRYQYLIDQEQDLRAARSAELEQTLGITGQQLKQKEQELRSARAKEQQLNRSYQLLLRERNLTRPLVDEGVVSEVEFLRLARQVNDLRGELENTRLEIPRLESAVAEGENRLNEAELQFRNQARAELNEVQAEIARLDESLEGMRDRLVRTEVRAPVKGVVKELKFNTVEGVIQPGDELLNIVPWEDNLLIEAQVRPADIAHINRGQKAVVKVSAYDFSIYGGLDAEVMYVSPSTVLNEEGESFYIVRLATDQSFLGSEKAPQPLIAGMTVSVDIITGRKSVLDYLLKPILKAQSKALTER